MPQTTSKSRKVTVEQLFDAWFELQLALKNLREAHENKVETQRVFDNLTKRASGQTCKEFIVRADVELY